MEHVHFIGIGGVGMSGLAQVLLARGARVSGSDPQSNAATERLSAQGATIYPRQVAANLRRERPDLVVVTAAVHAGNPEFDAAVESGVPVLSRAQLLGQLMAEDRGPRIAVAGTHGKTTTTAMLASVLTEAHADPTVLIGGDYAPMGGNARIGHGGIFLTEACEAYDSFLELAPDIAVVLNIEADHLDHFGTEERVLDSFGRFAGRTARGGVLVGCATDRGVQALLGLLPAGEGPARRLLYASSAEARADLWAEDVTYEGAGSRFRLVRRTPADGPQSLGDVRLSVPGEHNVGNALAAAAVGLELGLPFAAVARGLAAFTGAGRRFEVLGEGGGIVVVDDYAHHPTEIRATLGAARRAYPGRRLVAVFQPHLYSRTRDFMAAFAAELAAADAIIVAGIYAAREEPIAGVTAAGVVRGIAELAPEKTVLHIPDRADVPGALDWISRDGDAVIVMGAGDIRQAGEAFAGLLASRSAAPGGAP